MDEPLNPFSEQKRAEPGSRQRHYVCNSHCKLRHSLISGPLTVIGFLIKGVLMGEISFGPARLQASNLVFRCFLCACFESLYVWKDGGGWVGEVVGFLILFPSISFFLSLPVKTHLCLFPASFTPPLSFHPCFQPQGEILLWAGRPASHGFNPAMEFVIFDNLLMEAGIKGLVCVNKHRPHTPLWKAMEGERKQSSESWSWHSDKMPRC